MGDLVAAVDAAAHAALAYRRQDLRGSALGCSTRADALADQCGGASTPALRQATEPLPLTDREREIVMLIGEGLSNRAVAERLTLSVRTVEGHIYQAMVKTGTTSRDELAALLPRHTTRSHGVTFSHGGMRVCGSDNFKYGTTYPARPPQMHSAQVTDELSAREQALRRLPLPYSLALRLRDAGVAPDVICEYVNVEQAALEGFYRIAEAKLVAAQKTTKGRLSSTAPPPGEIPVAHYWGSSASARTRI